MLDGPPVLRPLPHPMFGRRRSTGHAFDLVDRRRLQTGSGQTALMNVPRLIYPTLEAYYAADERRRSSEEVDYGVHWRLHGWDYRWRVSYVRNTGEIYTVHQGSTIGPVFVLGRVPPDPVVGRGRQLPVLPDPG